MRYASLPDIENAMWETVKEVLGGVISGNVYKEGLRPLDSKDEDAVVVVSSGTARQIQEFSCYVNVYVPDIASTRNRYLKDRARMEEIDEQEQAIMTAFNERNAGLYEAELYSPTAHMAAHDINQHFVSFNFKISCLTFNNWQ